MLPFISVIIPVYNIKDYLEGCLNSVLNQNYQHIEIILVNDGSTDGSQIICEEYSKKFSQIKLINKMNGGLSDARNKGLLNASGEYILFLDGDDLLVEGILSRLIEYTVAKAEPEIVLFDYAKFYQQKNKIEPIERSLQPEILREKKEGAILGYLLEDTQDFSWMVWQFFYKKDFLLKNKFFFEKGRVYEDVLWMPEVLLNTQSIEYFKELVYIYRLEREGQITSTVTQKHLKDSIYLVVAWSEKLKKLKMTQELKSLLMNNFTIRYYYSIWFSSFIQPHEREEIFELLKKYKFLLKYSNGIITKTTRTFVKSIGFENTSLLFKSAITLKRKIAK